MNRTFRTSGRTAGRGTGRLRPSTRRPGGHVEAPSTLLIRDRYSAALAAGWRPLG